MAVADVEAEEAAPAAPAAAHGPPWPLGPLRASLEAEQDRWALWVPVLIGAGIAAYFALPSEPGLIPVLVTLPAALVLQRLAGGTLLPALVASALVCLSLGLVATKVRTEWVRGPVLERPLNRVEVRGFVELVEPRADRGERLTLRVVEIAGLAPEATPRRVRIRTSGGRSGLVPGDAARLRATLAAPASPALPGGFDFARTAYFERLGGVGYAVGRAARDPAAAPAPISLQAAAAIARLRQGIGERIIEALPGEAGAIANALITGERGGISEATNQAYRDSGLFHVLSISGLHMVVMAGAMFFSLRLVLAAVPAIALTQPIKKWAAAAAILATFAYLLLSGGAYATVRAAIMIAIMFIAVILDRPAIAMRNVAIAATLLLLAAPEALHDAGFQMSFAAVVALVATFEALRARTEQREAGPRTWMLAGPFFLLGGIVLTTLVASLATAPLAAFHFHKSQHYAVLANLIAIPICNLIVMPAALATLVVMPLGLEAVPLWLMGLGIEAMTWCARSVAALPGSVGVLPAMPVLAFGLFVAGGLWVCLWQRRWRWLGVLAILAGAAVAPFQPRPDILVGRDGAAVAVRRADGRFTALAGRGATYELARWLEHDGDGRTVRAAAAGDGFRCDAAGCTIAIAHRLVAVPRLPAALADDCTQAAILILPWPRLPGCTAPEQVVDFFALRDLGTHALYVGADAIRVETVAGHRGDRPWSPRGVRLPSPAAVVAAGRWSRLGRFAVPELRGFIGTPRPEIEDDEPAHEEREP